MIMKMNDQNKMLFKNDNLFSIILGSMNSIFFY